MNVQIIDSFAELGCKTSRFLTREEMFPVKPDYPQHRMNFIFKHEIPLEVEPGIGKLLVDKYDTLDYAEELKTEEDSLDEVDYNELKLLAVKKGINPHFVKKDELIEKLKKLE